MQRYIATMREAILVRDNCGGTDGHRHAKRAWEELDCLEVSDPSHWPYTIPREPIIPEEHKIGHPNPSSDSRFNLIHGYMWGRYADS